MEREDTRTCWIWPSVACTLPIRVLSSTYTRRGGIEKERLGSCAAFDSTELTVATLARRCESGSHAFCAGGRAGRRTRSIRGGGGGVRWGRAGLAADGARVCVAAWDAAARAGGTSAAPWAHKAGGGPPQELGEEEARVGRVQHHPERVWALDAPAQHRRVLHEPVREVGAQQLDELEKLGGRRELGGVEVAEGLAAAQDE
eukprot:4227626-Prymnesium_polylepis.1